MTTLCIDSDLDIGLGRRAEHALGAGFGLEQQRCLDILGDEFGSGMGGRGAPAAKAHEPMFDDITSFRAGTHKAA